MMTMINLLLNRFRLSARKPQPAPPKQNSFKQTYVVEFDPGQLRYLQRILDSEIEKHLANQPDQFCSSAFRINVLMWLDSLLPIKTSGMLFINGLEYEYLLAYITDRMLMMTRYQRSIIPAIELEILHVTLHNLRASLLKAAKVKQPLH